MHPRVTDEEDNGDINDGSGLSFSRWLSTASPLEVSLSFSIFPWCPLSDSSCVMNDVCCAVETFAPVKSNDSSSVEVG